MSRSLPCFRRGRAAARLLPAFALALGALLGPAPAAAGQVAAAPRVEARVDPRVEILSLVFRLAGNPEYGAGRLPDYARAMEAHFGELAGHPVVVRAAELRRRHGVSYDAVMSLAVHLDGDLRPLFPLEGAERLDGRWPKGELGPFLAELCSFADAGRAQAFFESQAELHELTARRMQAVLDEHLETGWFEGFFGSRPAARFQLSLALLNGGNCYGPSVLLPDGTEELHCVLGVWETDAEGRPAFREGMAATVVHEFCHSYCNALVDLHLEGLAGPAAKLWPEVEGAMRDQAYSNWQIMMRESLVRACVVRYQASSGGPEAEARAISNEHGRSFHWTGELAGVLARYEADRGAYPTLGDFMPEVVAFFGDYAERYAAERAAAPKVLRTEPASGAVDVDPATRALVVTFDRPMREGSWAVVGGGPNFPKVTGAPSYDDTRTVLTIPIALEPDWSYELWLNRGQHDSFQSAEGIKLSPVHVTFSTGAPKE